ncbi:MAG: hypothetical protein NC548_22725 [Lachnospiraceae bacterium]|nr:hypothetical protein [Lachnospiraceae bacterium]
MTFKDFDCYVRNYLTAKLKLNRLYDVGIFSPSESNFMEDLLNHFGDLIFDSALNWTEDIPDDLIDDFWGTLEDMEDRVPSESEIKHLYEMVSTHAIKEIISNLKVDKDEEVIRPLRTMSR